MKRYLLIICIVITSVATAQNVGIGTTTPNASAALDVSATNKGMLIPRVTTVQRKAIGSPALGLMVFDTDKGTVMFYDGSAWRSLSFSDETKTEPQSRVPSTAVANAAFGTRVAISGNYAVVGAPHYGAGDFQNMGQIFVFNKTTTGWRQVARLAAADSAGNDYYGGAVAISGDYIVVGCSNKKVGANVNQGKAYVYRRSGTNWVLDAELTKSGGAAYESFGWSVAVCAFNTGGPGITIGIPYSDVAGADRGEVYCYQRTGNTWNFLQNIAPGDLANTDYYGSTVVMDTDYVAVAAVAQDNTTYTLTDAGAVYVYVYGGGAWNFQQKLPGTVARGQFGLAMALSGSRLVVGAPWATTYTNTSSSVYIYQRSGATWTGIGSIFIYNFEVVPAAGQIQAVNSASAISVANLTFGMSLGLSGNTLIIGAPGGLDYPNGGASYYSDRVGSVYIYKNLTGNTYTRTGIIQSDFPTNGDLYGQSIGISNGQYIIGNPHATIGGQPYAGNVYFGNLAN